MIRESTKEADVHMYYVAAPNAHLCVVAAPADKVEYFVVTAYFTATIKKGKVLWRS